jgi:osmoprotectant transport system substrate-binding protein
MRRARGGALGALLAAGLLAAGCGGSDNKSSSSPTTKASAPATAAKPGEGKPPITIGTKDFTEEFVLGNLYKGALEAAGYTVKLKQNIGATEITDKALKSGQIDAYPEYTGTSLSIVFGKNELPKSAADTAQQVKTLYESRGQVVSNPTPFEDTDAIATTKDFATKNNLTSVADLANAKGFKLGAPPEFKSRLAGLKGMKQVYGINDVNFKPLSIGLQYKALDKNSVDAANVFSTDAQLASGKYTLLKDPKGVFGFQNVYFVINKSKYDALGGATFMAIINKVNSLLTNEAMQSMNSAVDIDKQDPASVAHQFLAANKLV